MPRDVDELLAAIKDLHAELVRVRRDGITLRVTEADREEIALRVYERIDERLAPADQAPDDPPRPRRGGRGR